MASSSSPSSSPISPLLGASLALNIAVFVFWAYHYNGGPLHPEAVIGGQTSMEAAKGISWTGTAAMEAEIAATFNCSGHGVMYPEALFGSPDYSPSCECDECFTGPLCELPVANCEAVADSGDPLMFLPYWRENSEASSVLIPGWYRMGYDLTKTIIPALENEIRAMHRLVGNAVTEGRYIVVGAGETQLAMAAYMAFSLNTQGAPLNVFSAPPYYDAFERQVKIVKPGNAIWSMPSSSVDGIPLEIVVSPNNPDGSLRTKVLDDEAWAIYDHAYYWPHYVPITKPLDHDFMMFTMSKVTGHAGSRIGWAIIKDFALYEKMILTLRLMSVKVSHESQLRAAHLLRTVREGYEKPDNTIKQHIFHYAHLKLSERWDKIIQLFQGSDRFLIDQSFQPEYCNFFKDVVKPKPAFVWIRCLKDEDQSCPALFNKVGVIGRGGARCGKTDQHVRLALLSSDAAFDNMIDRIQTLVS